jgi:DNA primase
MYMDSVQEIKAKLNIEDIVSEYVQLKRAGRNFKGLSPFTNENSPSFIVSPEKQIWHDFSSGKGGDMFSFIEQVEGLDFKGALALLARKAGVDLSTFQRSAGSGDSAKQKERLFQAVEAATNYYQVQLTKNESPLRYVREQRGYEKQTLIDFRFGYSPNSTDTLKKYLLGKGFSEKELLDSGLVVKRDNDTIDMFRNRLMVPLSDTQGKPVGFTARQLDNNKNAPKYINTKATILYDKSRQLYGFSQAKEAIRKSGYVVVVEGNLDVVASHQAGINQVVASAGTALTTSHLKSLQRFTGDVRLAFDDDRAGQEAAERTIPLAQSLGLELGFISIPSGKDPDELIRQDVSLWQKTVEAPVYMIDWLLGRIASQVDLASAPGKRKFTSSVLKIVKNIQDPVEQEHYLRIIADMTKTSLGSVVQKFANDSNAAAPRLKKINSSVAESIDTDKQEVREQHFLSILHAMPSMRSLITILPSDMFTPKAREYLAVTDQLQQMKKEQEYGKILTLVFEETYQHTDQSGLSSALKQLLTGQQGLINYYYTPHKTASISDSFQNAKDTAEKDKLKTELTQLNQLKSQVLSRIEELTTQKD